MVAGRLAVVFTLFACGKDAPSAPRDPPPTSAPSGPLPIALRIANRGACAIMSDKTVRCWGANDVGQLGNGTTTHGFASTTTNPSVGTPRGATSVDELVIDESRRCVLTRGNVLCWGSIQTPSLGPWTVPTQVPGATNVARLLNSVCATFADGSLGCWMWSPDKPLAVVREKAAPNVVAIAGGSLLHADGTVSYYVGDDKPYARGPLSSVEQLGSIGGRQVYCGMHAGGVVECFGETMFCYLGTADPIYTGDTFTTKPRVLDLPPAKQLALEDSADLCVVTTEGRLECIVTGHKPAGACGTHLTWRDLDHIEQMSGACARLADGTVRCIDTRLVDPITGTLERSTIRIEGVTGATTIAASGSTGCAITNGRVVCWFIDTAPRPPRVTLRPIDLR